MHEVLAYVESDRFFTKKQLSEYLPISTRTIENHLDEIPHYRLFNSILVFRKSEIDEWATQYKELGRQAELDHIADEAIESLLEEKR